MLTLLAAWAVLGVAAAAMGYRTLIALRATSVGSASDVRLIALWLGVLLLQSLLLMVALVVPLSTWTGLLVLGGSVGWSLRSSSVRRMLANDVRALCGRWGVAYGALVLGVAVLASKPVTWQDSGLYHLSAIYWLSEEGVVPGLALLHSRFGFVSSWFALHAPLNHGWLFARASTVGGGFVVLMGLAHLLVCWHRVLKGEARPADGFGAVAWVCVLPLLLWMGSSPTPDLPVLSLVIVSGWIAILLADRKVDTDIGGGGAVLPLLMGAGATAIKLSGAPLLLTGAVFLWIERKSIRSRDLLLSAAVAGTLLGPVLAAQYLITGCPFYPASILCQQTPWALGPAIADQQSAVIRSFTRWDGSAPGDAGAWNWIPEWALRHWITSLILVGSMGLLLVSAVSRRRISGRAQIGAISVLGVVYVLYSAPSPRFLISYALLPLALGAGHWLFGRAGSWRARTMISSNLGRWNPYAYVGTGLLVAAAAVFANARARSLTGEVHASQLLFPPRAGPDVTLVERRLEAFTYYTPADHAICWSVPAPCTPEITTQNIRLRNPTAGFGGGLVQKDAAADLPTR